MKGQRRRAFTLLVTLTPLAGGAIALAAGCGDDAADDAATPDGGGDTRSSADTSSSSDTGSPSSSGGPADSGGDAKEADGGDGGLRPNGATCNDPTQCTSGECFVGGTASFCTIKCTMKEQADPVCEALGDPFSGDCNKKGYCQKKN